MKTVSNGILNHLRVDAWYSLNYYFVEYRGAKRGREFIVGAKQLLEFLKR